MRLARVLGAIGRTMIAAGTLILLFVVYQLWGTGIRQAQAQSRLEDQFERRLQELAASTTTTTTSTTLPAASTTASTIPRTPVDPLAEAPPLGDPVGRIVVPRIGLDSIVVEGVGIENLKDGPGHYPETPLPGQKGNAAIAGHRTTYGAPFGDLDSLAAGDEITITTVQGSFTYEVTGHEVVRPSQVEVLDEKPGQNTLTLTACHPRYSAAERIVVYAALQGVPAPSPPPKPVEEQQVPVRLELDGESAPRWPAFVWGLVCGGIWLAAWLVGRRWRKWPSYAIGLPIFLIALFFFFENFSRLLPANF